MDPYRERTFDPSMIESRDKRSERLRRALVKRLDINDEKELEELGRWIVEEIGKVNHLVNCLCGQQIKYVHALKDTISKKKFWIGSTCSTYVNENGIMPYAKKKPKKNYYYRKGTGTHKPVDPVFVEYLDGTIPDSGTLTLARHPDLMRLRESGADFTRQCCICSCIIMFKENERNYRYACDMCFKKHKCTECGWKMRYTLADDVYFTYCINVHRCAESHVYNKIQS